MITFQQAPCNQLPNPNVDFHIILEIQQNLFRIMKYILLEVPVMVFCKDKYILSTIVEGLVTIIYPFKLNCPVITILPEQYYTIIGNFENFIIGIDYEYHNKFFEEKKLRPAKGFLAVKVDPKSCEQTSLEYIELPTKPTVKLYDDTIIEVPQTDTLPNLPNHYTQKVINQIKAYLYDKNGKKKDISGVSNSELRFLFYYYFISLFLHWHSCLTEEKTFIELYPKIVDGTIQASQLFKVNEFLGHRKKKIDKKDYPFFIKFFETNIWKNFLIQNFCDSLEEKFECLLFREKTSQKNNRNLKTIIKSATPFLDSKLLEHTQIKTVGLSMSIQNRSLTVKVQKKPNLKLEEEDLLNEDRFSIDKQKIMALNKNPEVKNLYEDFKKECIKITEESKFKDTYGPDFSLHLNSKIPQNMSPFVIKLWLKLFVVSFWYIEENERWVRFRYLLGILSKIMDFENVILDKSLKHDIMNCIIKYGDKEMCTELFKHMRVNEYIIYVMMNSKLSKNSKNFKKINYVKLRNFSISKVQIILDDFCSKCKTINDLKRSLLNFSDMDECNITFKCDKCKKTQQAKASIKEDTKTFRIRLYSPCFLFNYFKNIGKLMVSKVYNNIELFYNIIIHFQLSGLSFDFLFPYETESKQFYFDESQMREEHSGKYSYLSQKEPPKMINGINFDDDIGEDENDITKFYQTNGSPLRKKVTTEIRTTQTMKVYTKRALTYSNI